MARQPRLTVPDHPHHLIQRGNNRQPIFLDAQDRKLFLALLKEYAHTFSVAIHAYVLMDNHYHLLATPKTAEGLGQLIQALGRTYVRRFNARHGRTGTLWEGRYKSTVIQTDRYLLTCMAYIDLNPVRAGLCDDPADFAWSSHGHYIGRQVDPLVVPHALLWTLGNTPFAREVAYAEWVHAGLGAQDQRALTEATLQGWALGGDSFLSELQKQTARRVGPAARGRPPAKARSTP